MSSVEARLTVKCDLDTLDGILEILDNAAREARHVATQSLDPGAEIVLEDTEGWLERF